MPTAFVETVPTLTHDNPETFTCSCCHYEHPTVERHLIHDTELCEDCLNEQTVICECCEERLWARDDAGNGNISLCQRCYENHYTICEHCGNTIENDEAYYHDDDDYPYCCDCYERYHMGTIHSYSYKPEPIFYGDGHRYFGVELEIDDGGKDGYNAHKLISIANRVAEYLYIKSDSSLNNGLELISHPMTLDCHTDSVPWLDILNCSLHLGYLSHKSSTCGLHVHVNRDTFTEDRERQEECIGRVLFFMEKHWGELLKFSRRTEAELSRWAARYGLKSTPQEVLDHAKTNSGNRYTCLNLTNNATIEFRIFRGTLKHNTLIATLQLVDAICEVAFSLSDDQLAALSWINFVERITAPELIVYLKEQRLFINDPIQIIEEEQ